MKKTFTIIMLSLIAGVPLFFSSCSKKKNNTPSSGYYVSFQANGSQHTEKLSPVGVNAYNDTTFLMTITALTGESKETATEEFVLAIGSKTALKSGQTFNLLQEDDSNTGAVFIYTPDAKALYESDPEIEGSAANVKITNITSSTIQGTFSGKVFTQDGKLSATITDGNFYVPYTSQRITDNIVNKRINLKINLKKAFPAL